MLPSDENGDGIITRKTFSAPIASHASAATSAESMPPESPRTTFCKTIFARVIANAENQRLPDRFAFVARNAARIGLAHVELDRFDKFFKRRRLQNNVAFFVGDQARAVKNDPVVAADQIYENDRRFLQPARGARPCRSEA